MPKPVYTLCYHEITEKPASQWERSLEKLEEDFRTIKSEGIQVISLDTLVHDLSRQVTLPGKRIVITFDDATKGQFIHARPLLKKYAFPATFYANPALVDSGQPVAKEYSGIMTWQELRQLITDGFQVASHGNTHASMPSLSQADLKKDIRDSLRLLKSRLGLEVLDLALPYGAYRIYQEKYFVETGIRSIALTTTDNGPGNPGLVKIRRFEVKADTIMKKALDSLF